jgi:FHA domain/PilZ domain
MEARERRRSTRLHRQFAAHIRCQTGVRADGESENLSQGGAFISTENWDLFKPCDEIIITFLLPPEFTGQARAIGLQGGAVVIRVDSVRQGVGIEFIRSFRQFEQVSVADVPETNGEDTVAYYVSKFGGLLESEFVDGHPHGFLVEYSRRLFDRDVILQLDTQEASGREFLERNEISRGDLVAGKVFELKKKSPAVDPDKVTVGRSPTSDLVFQNKLVSRQHAYFVVPPAGKECLLVDMESTNGTFVNTRKLRPNEPCQLSARDEILFGYEVRMVYFSSRAFSKFLRQIAGSQVP